MGEEPPNAVTVGDSGWEDVLLKMNLFFKMASYTEDRWCWRSPTTVKEWLFQFGLFYASCWTSCPLCPKCAPHFVQKNVCFSLKCRKTHESCPPMLGHFFVERLLSPTPQCTGLCIPRYAVLNLPDYFPGVGLLDMLYIAGVFSWHDLELRKLLEWATKPRQHYRTGPDECDQLLHKG